MTPNEEIQLSEAAHKMTHQIIAACAKVAPLCPRGAFNFLEKAAFNALRLVAEANCFTQQDWEESDTALLRWLEDEFARAQSDPLIKAMQFHAKDEEPTPELEYRIFEAVAEITEGKDSRVVLAATLSVLVPLATLYYSEFRDYKPEFLERRTEFFQSVARSERRENNARIH